MTTHTPYLDCVILAAAAYPSGLSYSLFTTWRGRPSRVTPALLAMMVLPFLIVVPAVAAAVPELVPLRGTSWMWIGAAAAAVPAALFVEYLIHAFAAWRATGLWPRRIAVQSEWPQRPSLGEQLLLAAIAVGEECFYRGIWIGALRSFGVPVPIALLVSAIGYGLNHLSFGKGAVVSKSASGLLYGALYLLSGGSLLAPVVAHVLQNVALFEIGRARHA